MNPAEVLEQKRMLELSAARGSIAAQAGLKLLEPIFTHIQDNLMIRETCGWGSNPGVQHCPRCYTTFTTLQARAREIFVSSTSSLSEDAAAAVIDLGDAGDPNRHRDHGRQPVDMDGTFPQECRPGHFGPEVLNITIYAEKDISEDTRARQCPPQNRKRTGPHGTFRFLTRSTVRAIADETPEDKAKRERKKTEDFAMDAYRKAVNV